MGVKEDGVAEVLVGEGKGFGEVGGGGTIVVPDVGLDGDVSLGRVKDVSEGVKPKLVEVRDRDGMEVREWEGVEGIPIPCPVRVFVKVARLAGDGDRGNGGVEDKGNVVGVVQRSGFKVCIEAGR